MADFTFPVEAGHMLMFARAVAPDSLSDEADLFEQPPPRRLRRPPRISTPTIRSGLSRGNRGSAQVVPLPASTVLPQVAGGCMRSSTSSSCGRSVPVTYSRSAPNRAGPGRRPAGAAAAWCSPSS